MRGALKDGKVNLAQDGGKSVVQLPEEDIFLTEASVSRSSIRSVRVISPKVEAVLRQRQAGVLGVERVLLGHHGMYSVPELVRHGGDVVGFALVIQQHPGSARAEWWAERAAHLTFAHFAVHMLFREDAPGFAGKDLVEALEGFEGKRDGFFVAEAFIRFGDRRVDIVAAQLVHA